MDRKARIREFKETPRPMGVYQVRNTVDGKLLVGATTDLPSMLNRLKAQLFAGVHLCLALQQDWNRLGPEAFAFEVVDTLAPPEDPAADPTDDLRLLEQLWLEELAPFGDRGYNVRPAGHPGAAPPRATGR